MRTIFTIQNTYTYKTYGLRVPLGTVDINTNFEGTDLSGAFRWNSAVEASNFALATLLIERD